MRTRDFELETADGPMPCFEAVPDEAPRNAVVVIQEAWGVNAHIRDVAARLASAGYHAVAPAYFHRVDAPPLEDYSDVGAIFPMFEGMSDDSILLDTDAVLAFLRERGFVDAGMGVVGFCMGGRASLLVSLRRALGAGVGFYGGGIVRAGRLPFPPLLEELADLRTPWLGLFGEEDAGIPVADVEAIRDVLGNASVESEVVRYPGAGHGFHCDARADYHQASAEDAWARTLDWFGAHLA